MNLDGLSWCETIAASGVYHLRRLSDAGQKLTGGADTSTLCGMKPAWDVGYPVTEATVKPAKRPNYGWPCPRCVKALEGVP